MSLLLLSEGGTHRVSMVTSVLKNYQINGILRLQMCSVTRNETK